MNNINLTEPEILAYVELKYRPDIVLLGGSRARGGEREDSDWDLYLIGSYEKMERFPQIFQGADLDIAVYPPETIEQYIFQLYYGPVSDLKVLKDNAKLEGARIVEATQIAYEKGPKRLEPREHEQKKYELMRLLAKVKPLLNTPAVATFVLAEFYRQVIPIWFLIRGRWSLPIVYALREIEIHDPKFAALLHRWVSSGQVERQQEIGHEMLQHLFINNRM